MVRFATGSGEVLHPMERKEFTIELERKSWHAVCNCR